LRQPEAGFTGFPRYEYGISSEELCERLLEEKGVLMSPGNFFGEEQHLRINTGSLGCALAEALARLSDLVDGLSIR
jgi:aspartate/methionine/tyrosine aminotransferase